MGFAMICAWLKEPVCCCVEEMVSEEMAVLVCVTEAFVVAFLLGRIYFLTGCSWSTSHMASSLTRFRVKGNMLSTPPPTSPLLSS